MAPPPPPPPPLPPPLDNIPPPPAPPPPVSAPVSTEQPPQNAQPQPQANSSGNNGEKVWERPWTIQELRKGTTKWNLAADAGVSSKS